MSFVEDEVSDCGVDSRSRLESYAFSKSNSDAQHALIVHFLTHVGHSQNFQ